MKRMLTLFALGLMVTATAYGDIARPKPTKPVEPKEVVHTSIEILPDAKTSGGARLQLSESTVKELRDALNAGTTSQSFIQRVGHSRTNTIVAGVLMFMSISFAGIWLMRSSNAGKGRSQKIVAGVLIGVATLGAAAIITQANAGPPPAYRWRNLTKNLTAGKPTNGGVVIEIVPDGVGAKLIVPMRNSADTNDD